MKQELALFHILVMKCFTLLKDETLILNAIYFDGVPSVDKVNHTLTNLGLKMKLFFYLGITVIRLMVSILRWG